MGVDSASITELAAYARSLYRRARTSGPDFDEVASVVRSLHTVVKHLRAEAQDPDSLLNGAQQQSSVYARQLAPLLEDTDFTLKQLDTILHKYGSSPSDGGIDDGVYHHLADHAATKLENREKDMLQLLRIKLSNQKTHIDIFLDTVQLHNPARQPPPVRPDQVDAQLQNNIKDKIDVVAARCFQRRARARASGEATDDSEELWQQFSSELAKEGFASDVLQKHKEVLRAYIRGLDATATVDENPPSVRGLLSSAHGGPAYAPQQFASYPETPAPADGSRQQHGSSFMPLPMARGDPVEPKEIMSPTLDNEKFSPAVKLARRLPEQAPTNRYNPQASPATNSTPVLLPWERSSSDSVSDTDVAGSQQQQQQQLALISTQDLMDCDRQHAESLVARTSRLHLSPALRPASEAGALPDTSPNGRYLPPPPPSTHRGQSSLSPEPSMSASDSSAPRAFGTSPQRILPPSFGGAAGTAYGTSPISPSKMTPPPGYSVDDPVGFTPASAPPASNGLPPPYATDTASPRCSRLAPDSKGIEIPLDAKWTRIKRSLVSPEVLDKAGFRYEARPGFVAVLGVLSKEEIAEFARKSADIRASRVRPESTARSPLRSIPRAERPERRPYHNNDTKTSPRHSDTTESDSTSSDTIWDESDSSSESGESDSQQSRTQRRRGSSLSSYTDKYIPRNVQQEQQHQQQYRRRRSHHQRHDSIIHEESFADDDVDDKHDSSHRHERTRKPYPVIVPPPMEAGSPASTVSPKPILKNRNENHVRFDEDGPREMTPSEYERQRERRERRERREYRHASERDSERRRDRDRRDRDRGDRDRGDRDRDRERDRDRSDRHRERDPNSSHSTRHRDKDRERDKDKDDASRSDRRRARKSVWGETLGAVGVGGAAATLLTVLTEAASQF
ncbi:hypothetical protein BD289DRAFT_486833 [Coniella lustricola]|uniref:DUF8035 domain-containing protein n=1 Tax=Coniella lustricola TaxID=2025994 RepID=A0A2T2ZTV9_9PEZI|nr:hypothetical protein BD289DRAFT_486833 [Coniella lustricola]